MTRYLHDGPEGWKRYRRTRHRNRLRAMFRAAKRREAREAWRVENLNEGEG